MTRPALIGDVAVGEFQLFARFDVPGGEEPDPCRGQPVDPERPDCQIRFTAVIEEPAGDTVR